MRRVLFPFLCVLFTTNAFASEKKAHLQFLSNTPVNLNSEVTININQSLPGLSLSTRGTQLINAIVAIQTEHSDLPITKPPFDVTFILKTLKISMRANDEDLVFDSEDRDSSLYLSQVSKIVDRPIRIHFGEGFKLATESKELEQIVKELPVLQEINPQQLLMDVFFPFFALAGIELKEGMTIDRTYIGQDNPAIPGVFTYTITSIDDYNIHANLKGEVEKKFFSLAGLVKVNDEDEQAVNVTLKGIVEGKGKWNRDNSMLCDLEVHYSYTAMFKLGEWEWMMNIGVDVHNRTKLKN
jgi:hypothetical protein